MGFFFLCFCTSNCGAENRFYVRVAILIAWLIRYSHDLLPMCMHKRWVNRCVNWMSLQQKCPWGAYKTHCSIKCVYLNWSTLKNMWKFQLSYEFISVSLRCDSTVATVTALITMSASYLSRFKSRPITIWGGMNGWNVKYLPQLSVK